MTTARAKLHAELVEILSEKDKSSAEQRLQTLLDRYRVQYKSPPADKSKTARETLFETLSKMVKSPPADLVGQIATMLDDYRMQAKSPPKPRGAGRAGDAGKRAKKTEAKATAKTAAEAPPAPEPSAPQAKSSAGGRKQSKRSTRAECPKCHSMGVVLARSYATDEYYSCIYCGWQGFKAPDAIDAQDSLAARLLGLYNSTSQDDGEA